MHVYIYIYTYTYICQLCQYRIFPSIAITHNQFKYLQTSGRTSARDTTGFAVGSRTPCFTVTKCVIFPCCFKLYTSFPICAFEMYFQISKYIIFYVCIYIYINKHIIVCMYVYIYTQYLHFFISLVLKLSNQRSLLFTVQWDNHRYFEHSPAKPWLDDTGGSLTL